MLVMAWPLTRLVSAAGARHERLVASQQGEPALLNELVGRQLLLKVLIFEA
jgi:hypothetical protein